MENVKKAAKKLFEHVISCFSFVLFHVLSETKRS